MLHSYAVPHILIRVRNFQRRFDSWVSIPLRLQSKEEREFPFVLAITSCIADPRQGDPARAATAHRYERGVQDRVDLGHLFCRHFAPLLRIPYALKSNTFFYRYFVMIFSNP